MSSGMEISQVADITRFDVSGTVMEGEEGQRLENAVKGHLSEGKRRFVVNLSDVGHVGGDAAAHLVAARTAVLAAGGHFALVLPGAGTPKGSGWREATWRHDTVKAAIASLLRK